MFWECKNDIRDCRIFFKLPDNVGSNIEVNDLKLKDPIYAQDYCKKQSNFFEMGKLPKHISIKGGKPSLKKMFNTDELLDLTDQEVGKLNPHLA